MSPTLELVICIEMRAAYESLSDLPPAEAATARHREAVALRHAIRACAWLKYGCTYPVIAAAEERLGGHRPHPQSVGYSIDRYLRDTAIINATVGKDVRKYYK